MAGRKEPPIPILRIKKGDNLKEINLKARRAITAADIADFANMEEGVPVERVLAQMEAIERTESSKRKKKPRHGHHK